MSAVLARPDTAGGWARAWVVLSLALAMVVGAAQSVDASEPEPAPMTMEQVPTPDTPSPHSGQPHGESFAVPEVTPTFDAWVADEGADWDPEAGPGAPADQRPALSFDFEVWAAQSQAPAAAESVVAVRPYEEEPTFSEASWTVPAGALADGGSYRVRVRAVWPEAPAGVDPRSAWSGWFSFEVVVAPSKPVLVSPASGVLQPTPRATFTARAEPIQASYDGWRGIVRIDANVNGSGGMVVVQGFSQSLDEDGVFSWTPPSDLRNGDYFWQAAVTNGVFQSEWSEPRPLWVVAPPAAPTGVTGTSDHGQSLVQWTYPNSAPGESYPVSGFVVTASPSGRTASVPSGYRQVWITDLPMGTQTFSVQATNFAGPGEAGVSAPVQVLTGPPKSPVNFDAAVDKLEVALTWGPPLDDGGSEILDYTVSRRNLSAGGGWQSFTTTATSLTLSDHVAGDDYGFRVQARTDVGLGPAAYTTGTPFTVPDAPADVTTRPDDGAIDLVWTTPEFDGGRYLTGYLIQVEPGGHTLSVPNDAAMATVGGLENGTEYTVTVRALNEAGIGPASEAVQQTPLSGTVDTDGDLLPDIVEHEAGSDPTLMDSDGDGLGDAFEVLHLGTVLSPTASDTDLDGTPDAEEDSDGDGLTNTDEQLAQTIPLAGDSDKDALADGPELARD